MLPSLDENHYSLQIGGVHNTFYGILYFFKLEHLGQLLESVAEELERVHDCDQNCFRTVTLTVLVYAVISNVLLLVVSSMVIHGVRTSKERFLTPCHIYSVFTLVVNGLVYLTVVAMSFVHGAGLGYLMAVILGALWCFLFCFMKIVRGYQLQVRVCSCAPTI